MRVLIVASHNKGFFSPFIEEQTEALRNNGCEVLMFGVEGKGLIGYLKNLPALKRKIKELQPEIIHAHYGMCGLLASLQRIVPVVVTYHGSDINDRRVLRFSKLSMCLSAGSIFVSQKMIDTAKPKNRYALLPCGINLSNLQQTERYEAKRRMCLEKGKRYILFAGAFDNKVKDAELAKQVVSLLVDKNAELLELKGYNRNEVDLLMSAVDALLMTSHTEGSPQVIKEALACGLPIVSVDVGDVRERVNGINGCFVSQTRKPEELAGLLDIALNFVGKTDGRNKIVLDGLENCQVAEKLMEIYKEIC